MANQVVSIADSQQNTTNTNYNDLLRSQGIEELSPTSPECERLRVTPNSEEVASHSVLDGYLSDTIGQPTYSLDIEELGRRVARLESIISSQNSKASHRISFAKVSDEVATGLEGDSSKAKKESSKQLVKDSSVEPYNKAGEKRKHTEEADSGAVAFEVSRKRKRRNAFSHVITPSTGWLSPEQRIRGQAETERGAEESKSYSVRLLLERKRRTEIRQQFDRLTTIVPHTKGMARSEAIVLRRTVDALKAEEAERKRLIARLEELGERVEDEFKR